MRLLPQLGLVQMTRKRVGQGLIEAFSTTCESCGGRGIHIHSEPVKKIALDKDMDQRYVPSSERDEESLDEVDSAPEVSETPVEERSEVRPARKRRRAVSTGVITPA